MKRNRGRGAAALLWLLPVWLFAQTTYQWSATQSKTQAAQFEAVAVEYVCRFSTEGYEYIIAFDPPAETEAYRLVLERAREQIVDGKRVNRYRFIVFPKQAGKLTLALSASMEHTTKASIENTVIGRDNVEKIAYTTKKVDLPPVSVTVSPHENVYAGHLQLSVDVDKKTAEAYAPVQVRVQLHGYGNIDTMPAFNFDIPGVRQFSDGEQKRLKIGDRGFEGSITQQFAIVSDRNFTLPSLKRAYYDTEQNRTVTLESEPVTVTVRPAAVRPSAVPADAAQSGTKPDTWSWSWLHLLLALGAGIVIGRFLLPVGAEKEHAALPKKLMQCRDPEKFAAYLAMHDAEKYGEIINEIERDLKAGKPVKLGRYKRLL
ncbi:MAG: hypothetical protein P8Y51_07145 [Campylobacterales bacterium]